MTAAFSYNNLILALTPIEKWQAAQNLDSSFSIQQWIFMFAGLVFAALIITGFIKFARQRAGQDTNSSNIFHEQANKRGLSEQESRVLLYIARLAELGDSTEIFTMKKAFDLGAHRLTREAAGTMDCENIKRLTAELGRLREKLGYLVRLGEASDAADGDKPSSRTIPRGKNVYVTRRTSHGVDDIEATVIANSDEGLAVRLPFKVDSMYGEQWQVRYFYGASVWEFDVPVISGQGDVLVLGHSNNIRFINRRRFLRVPVNRRAFIAAFPFEKDVNTDSGGDSEKSQNVFESGLVLPQFIPAVLTELAGPGLRFESALELKINQAVAVVFELEFSRHQQTEQQEHEIRIIQATGRVRHIREIEKGFSVAVEMTGLAEAEINELIRATNIAAASQVQEHGTVASEQSAAAVLAV
ncbi:MAG: hypothetical protein WC374_07025 [Phycisphaerae bacterium]|jgi:hypothetical protein